MTCGVPRCRQTAGVRAVTAALDPGGRELVLASGSPRRHELLARLGVPFSVVAADVDETAAPDEPADALVARLAAAKALVGAAGLDPDRRGRSLVVGADTVVTIDGAILGKPGGGADGEAAAVAMLRRLSGRTHRVVTGMAIAVDGEFGWARNVAAEVTFRPLDDALIAWYVATGEPHDKAGGYALQGAGAALVESVSGSASAIVGLALAELLDGLRALSQMS